MAETGPGGSLPAVYALEVAAGEVADPEAAGARYREERDGAGEGTVVTSVVVSAALAGALLGAGRLSDKRGGTGASAKRRKGRDRDYSCVQMAVTDSLAKGLGLG